MKWKFDYQCNLRIIMGILNKLLLCYFFFVSFNIFSDQVAYANLACTLFL